MWINSPNWKKILKIHNKRLYIVYIDIREYENVYQFNFIKFFKNFINSILFIFWILWIIRMKKFTMNKGWLNGLKKRYGKFLNVSILYFFLWFFCFLFLPSIKFKKFPFWENTYEMFQLNIWIFRWKNIYLTSKIKKDINRYRFRSSKYEFKWSSSLNSVSGSNPISNINRNPRCNNAIIGKRISNIPWAG